MTQIIIAHRRLKFTVLQQIFAKGKGLHSFLKDEELNNQKNVFFFPTEENAQGTNCLLYTSDAADEAYYV